MSASITACALPDEALLRRYLAWEGAYVDCYATEISAAVSHAEYVEAFYTTAVFRIERWLLRLVSKPSTDTQAAAIASGAAEAFAAWTVEARATDQLLLTDFIGRTRSWFMVVPLTGDGAPRTRLYFGSAVVSKKQRSGRVGLGLVFRVLLGFHKLYSRVLLRAARSRLQRRHVAQS